VLFVEAERGNTDGSEKQGAESGEIDSEPEHIQSSSRRVPIGDSGSRQDAEVDRLLWRFRRRRFVLRRFDCRGLGRHGLL
jgi:hypothetical protein